MAPVVNTFPPCTTLAAGREDWPITTRVERGIGAVPTSAVKVTAPLVFAVSPWTEALDALKKLGKLMEALNASMVMAPAPVIVTPIEAGEKGVSLRYTSPPKLKAEPLVKLRLMRDPKVPTELPNVIEPLFPPANVRV